MQFANTYTRHTHTVHWYAGGRVIRDQLHDWWLVGLMENLHFVSNVANKTHLSEIHIGYRTAQSENVSPFTCTVCLTSVDANLSMNQQMSPKVSCSESVTLWLLARELCDEIASYTSYDDGKKLMIHHRYHHLPPLVEAFSTKGSQVEFMAVPSRNVDFVVT